LFCDSNGYFEDDRTPAEREQVYGEALDKLSTLYALIKQGRAYLEKRLSDPELKPDIETSIAAWLGHAWQLAELREAGLMTPNVEMMQLAFNCCDDRSRQEFIDSGIWIDLASGKLYCTKNYRPYKAAKFIKAEDSFFQVAQIPELFIYPGDMNQRIRWEGMTTRPTIDKDFAAIKKFAQADFAAMAKQVKGNLKGPLSEKQPVCLLKFKRIGMVEETLCVEDVSGNRLTMTDRGIAEEPPSLQLLRLVPSESLVDQVLIARFRHDFDTKRLEVKPLAIVTSNDVVRLTL
ncbi:MAG: hypothetical protein U0930_23605, partial [Pirellulales bacterium]